MSLRLRVTDIEIHTPQIRGFRLEPAEGGTLPGWTAGAHIRLTLPLAAGPAERAYSLITTDPAADTTQSATHYRIAVRREDAGRGGSAYLHTAVAAGDVLEAQPPRNDFALVESGPITFLAGGIGITPLLAMAAAMRRAGRAFRFHYSGREAAQLALVPALQALAGDDLALHADDDAATRLDIAALVVAEADGRPLYVCGPQGLLDAVLAATRAAGWAADRVHFELFTEAAARTGDQPFTLVLAQSGRELAVAAGQTPLDAMLAAGLDPLFDCRRGECGVCACAVIEGEVDHRDYCLSDAEKAAGKTMQICVSRARGPRLVIDA